MISILKSKTKTFLYIVKSANMLSNTNEFFVFGSNEAGRHGLGAAKTALNRFGAIYGIGYGMQGQSFGIPTKDSRLNKLDLNKIVKYIYAFIRVAELNPELVFYVTRIGCGLAGYKDETIAHIFLQAPSNCIFDENWKPYLGTNRKYFSGEL